MAESGQSYDPPRDYAKVDKNFAGRVAQAYEEMPHAPDDPAVKAAYDALARETLAQWQHVKKTGLKVDWITPEGGDPYADNPRGAIKDIRDNNHWHGFPTDLGFGTGDPNIVRNSPMLADSGEEVGGRRTSINDIFRIVHDYFGHAKEGHGFRGEGEDNAFRSHAAMYSDAAKPAMTAELRGQNSWLNYGPHGEHNRTAKAADTIFATQKTGVMPEWSYRESAGGGMGLPLMAPQLVGRPATSLVGEEEHLRRLRQGLEPPGGGRQVEWTGGRISMADGGMLEPVDHNPFPPEPQVQESDINRAKGFPEPRSPMHDRIGAASVDPETGYPVFDPATNVPREPQKQVSGGQWGKAAELGYEDIANSISGAADWAGDKLQQGVSGVAGAVGVPNPELLGRDVRAAFESPMLGEAAGAPRIAEERAPRLGGAGSDVSSVAEAPRAKILDVNGVKRHLDPEFPESRVGTSIAKKSDANAAIEAEQAAHANNNAHVGMELAGQVPTYGKSVADMVRSDKIPYVKTAAGADDAAVQEALIEHMKDNLLGLYSRVSPDVRSGSKLWYEGAHSRSRGIAETHNIPHENAAGVVAAMSPQKDWDQNVTLADWVAHTAGTTADDATMSPEMTDWVNRYALRKDPESVVTDPATGRQTRVNAKTGEPMHPASVSQQDVQRQLAQVSGKAWGQMTPDQKAFYTRAYYEAHGPPDHLMPIDDQTGEPAHWIDDKGDRKYGYYINNPDGTHNGVTARYGDEYVNVKDQPIPVSWGSTGEVANAIQAFHAQSMSDISEALGDGHKVRSFFNNIIAPWSKKGDLTSDTHAVAAALLRPLGAGAPEAASGMGAASPNNAETGLKGFYPHVAEAYRRAAKKAGILPREMQSITWEALRGLWSPREKMAKTNVKKGFTSPTDLTNAIWQRYKNGEISMQDAHNEILGPQGERINPPRWFETFQP